MGLKQYHNPDFFEDFITTLQAEMEGGDEEEDEMKGLNGGLCRGCGLCRGRHRERPGRRCDHRFGAHCGSPAPHALIPKWVPWCSVVNSPGGSALASDVIWRETVLLKEAGKPVVASMSDLAASGGYYISCAADHILAQPNTITGSIGVFGVLPSCGKLAREHIGLDFDGVKLHDHADALNGHTPVQGEALAAINEGVTEIYDSFIERVAEGLGMTVDGVNEVARPVWTRTGRHGHRPRRRHGQPAGCGGHGGRVVRHQWTRTWWNFRKRWIRSSSSSRICRGEHGRGGHRGGRRPRRRPGRTALEAEALVHAAPQDRIQARMPYTIRLY